METVEILKMVFFASSIISLLITISLFLSNIIGLVERFRKLALSLAENAFKRNKKGEGVISLFFLSIYRFRDVIVISIFAFGIISFIVFSYLDIFFTEPYVTYELFIGSGLTLITIILLIYTNLNGALKEVNKELRDIREAVGEIKGWTISQTNRKK